ncbi:MAG: MotA/TolQ/ExbB proton channel family protein [Magnetococcus sp. YQC-9]
MVIGGFLLSLGIFYLQTRKIGKQIVRGLRLVQQQGASESPDQDYDLGQNVLRRKLQFARNWQTFRQGMEQPEMHFFASAWAEFIKHITLPAADSQQAVRTSADPSLYFNERSLYFVNINTRLFDAIPGFLTGGGIFGTFVGLVAGIYLAQDGMAAGPQEMKQAMKFLMGGVSTAFITSIFGIGLSILFSIMEKRRQHWIGRLVHQFCEQLEACFEIQHREDSGMAKLHIAQMEQVAELKKLTRLLQTKTVGSEQTAQPAAELETRIGASLAPAIGKMFETLVRYQDNQRATQQQAMQGALAPLFEQFQNTLGEKLSAIELGLFALNENLRNQNAGMNDLWRDLRASGQEGLLHTAQSIRAAFDDFGVQFTQLMRESSAGSLNSLNQAMSRLTDSLAALHTAQEAQLRGVAEGLNRYQGDLRGFGDRQGQALAQLVTGLNDTTGQGQKRLEQLLAGLNDTSDQGQKRLEQLFSTLQGANDQSSQRLEQLVSSLHKGIVGQNERLTLFVQDAARILSELKNNGEVQSTHTRQTTSSQEKVVNHLLANLADVAAGMKSSQIELAAGRSGGCGRRHARRADRDVRPAQGLFRRSGRHHAAHHQRSGHGGRRHEGRTERAGHPAQGVGQQFCRPDGQLSERYGAILHRHAGGAKRDAAHLRGRPESAHGHRKAA